MCAWCFIGTFRIRPKHTIRKPEEQERDGNACYAGIIYQQQDLDRIRESVLGPVSRPRTGETGLSCSGCKCPVGSRCWPGGFPFRLIATRLHFFTGLLPPRSTTLYKCCSNKDFCTSMKLPETCLLSGCLLIMRPCTDTGRKPQHRTGYQSFVAFLSGIV